MEFAAYVYDAWAYEQAHQQSPDMNLDICPEFYFDKSQVDRLACMLSPIKKLPYLACVLSVIAVTGLGNWGGNFQPAIAANQLAETAVNVAPWCDNLYLCKTSYVLEVQTLLLKNGFDTGELDGVYGRYTKQAVIDFQKSQKNLVVDGIPGGKTLTLLRSSSGAASTTKSTEQNTLNNSQVNSQPSSQNNNQTNRDNSDRDGQIVIVRSNNSEANNPQITESGDMGNLQMLLKQRGFYRGEIDGQKGQSTTDAISKAQRAYGLVPDGFAGPLTIRALLAGGNDIALAQPMFKRSPKNQDVLEIQKLLKERGFYDEALNGLYNLQTKAGIFQAQLAYSQSATGEVSPELITALKAQNLDQEVAPNPLPNAPINNGQANVQNNQNNQDIRPSPNNSQAPSSGQNAPAPPQRSSNSS